MDLSLEFETEEFRRWTEEIVRGMSEYGRRDALRAMAMTFLRRVIQRTPVDTGRARGGWASFLVSQGVAVRDEGEEWEVGVTEGFFFEEFGGTGRGSLAMVNAVPYIVFLEFGSSKQAPAGMVRITMRELRSKGVARDAVQKQLERAVTQANRTMRRPRLPG